MTAPARFWDPEGERYGLPTWPFRYAPAGLATRRQLRAQGLRPGGQDVAGQILWGRGGERCAYLYRVELARPVRPMTPGRARALAAAMRARRTCPECGKDRGYCIRTSVGMCEPCERGRTD